MGCFVIADTEFGIDPGESRLVVKPTGEGSYLLNIEVTGDATCHQRLREDESSPWSWASYPPNFYVRGFPIRATSAKDVQFVLTEADIDRFDIALYMMEHNYVDNVKVRIVDSSLLEVSGFVDLMGERAAFRIEWSNK